MDYKVVKIDGSRGTSAGVPAVLDTGLSLTVPKFIEIGQLVRINTADKVYVERA
jgi:hypothetical protein